MSFHDWKYLRFALELAPAHPPLAYPIYASGMENRSAIAGGLAPAHPPLAYPIYASGMENASAYAAGLAPLDQPRPLVP